MAAFPLAKFRFPGSRAYEFIVMIALLFVYDVTYIPQYVILSAMHLIDTIWAVVLPAMSGHAGAVPDEAVHVPASRFPARRGQRGRGGHRAAVLDDRHAQHQARLDHRNHPTFQALWNRDTSTYVFTEQLKNLPAVFRQISATNTIATAGIGAAAAVLLMIPPIVVFIFSQSRMLETMAYSGMKG